MQETWKLTKLNPPDLEQKGLVFWFNDVMDLNCREIGIFLSYYYRKDGAIVEKVRLIPPATDLTEMNGSISVSFELVYFNACLNIHETTKDKLDLAYSISTDGTILTLTGPNWPEREPDEI